jgi:hypothetical protein
MPGILARLKEVDNNVKKRAPFKYDTSNASDGQ